MSRVCSMESKATLSVLVRRAGTRVAKTKFRRSWKGKDSWHVREKSVWFAYLLKEPPESPVLSSDQSNMGKLQHQRQHRNSTGLSEPITTTKKSHHSLNQKLLSAQPTNLATHVVQQCIPDLRQAYYKANTYIKSTHRALLGQYIYYL